MANIPGVPPGHPEPLGPKQPHELNIASLCQMGQDTVQELVQKVSEVFQNFKLMQLPNGTQPSMRNTQNVSKKIADSLVQIESHFKRLKHVYRECQKKLPDDVDPCVLIPHTNQNMDSGESLADELPRSQKEIFLEQKKSELETILNTRNEQLKNLLEQMRNLVWEVNSVLSTLDSL
ncbi:mediator of RNA polymerase II transcription subunit 30-like [Styela clava]